MSGEVYFNRDYPALADGYAYRGQPVLISEFGGISLAGDDGAWGYGDKENTQEDFLRRFDEIVTAVKKLDYVCGYCYTQLADVQQETNGLLDADRRYKFDPAVIREINGRDVNPLQK